MEFFLVCFVIYDEVAGLTMRVISGLPYVRATVGTESYTSKSAKKFPYRMELRCTEDDNHLAVGIYVKSDSAEDTLIGVTRISIEELRSNPGAVKNGSREWNSGHASFLVPIMVVWEPVVVPKKHAAAPCRKQRTMHAEVESGVAHVNRMMPRELRDLVSQQNREMNLLQQEKARQLAEAEAERLRAAQAQADAEQARMDVAKARAETRAAQGEADAIKAQIDAEKATARAAEAALRRECCICFDAFQLTEGVKCHGSEAHFTCDTCFTAHVKAEADVPLALMKQRGGAHITCPGFKCDAPHFRLTEIAQHAPEAFECVHLMHERLTEQRLADEIRREERQRCEKELERRQQLGERERQIVEARRHITEDILTLKCPRCAQAFLDFEGCFALKCNNCNCGFCAWCFEDSGSDDAHTHVRLCKHKPPGADVFYGTLQQFAEAKIRSQEPKLRTYIAGLDPDIRGDVVKCCHQDLADVGHQAILADY